MFITEHTRDPATVTGIVKNQYHLPPFWSAVCKQCSADAMRGRAHCIVIVRSPLILNVPTLIVVSQSFDMKTMGQVVSMCYQRAYLTVLPH
jgi:hypothetical protein